MTNISSFKPEHLDQFSIADNMERPVLEFVGPVSSVVLGNVKKGPAFTLINDTGAVVAIGGVVRFWPGSGEVWLMVSDQVQGYKKSLCVAVQKCLSVISVDFHRIQASVLLENVVAHKFAFFSGFVPECTVVKYGPAGEDFIRYVWIKEVK